MFNWNDIRVLLEVARANTLSGAAEKLEMDSTTVGRRLQSLEQQLNTQLFSRVSGRLSLTDDGERVLEYAQSMEHAAIDIEQITRPDGTKAAGRVRVSTTRTMARAIMYPVAESMTKDHPDIVLEIDDNVQRVDMMRGDADIALTCYMNHHPRLIRRKLFTATGGLYAAKSYLETHDRPSVSFDGHKVLAVAEINLQTGVDKYFEENVRGGEVVLRSSSVTELMRLCAEGRGISLLFHFAAQKRPELVHLDNFPDFRLTHWLTTHPDLNHLARIRVVKDAIFRRVAELRIEMEYEST
ncbi:MAG: LysR family transcriptional regulator [Myxococcales bacterium]|nr:LysR family transcriptional regulator [Myxococcales bacterium]